MWGKYNLINTPELIKSADEFLISSSGKPNYEFVSYDTETNGLGLHKTSIVGFSWAVDRFKGFYLPILTWVPDPSSRKMRTIKGEKMEVFTDGHLLNIWTGQIHEEFVRPKNVDFPDWIPGLLKRWFSNSQLYMWNAPFDVNHTYINFGVDLGPNLMADGGLLVHVANENESVGLKESAVVYKDRLGINPYAMADQEKRELKQSILRNGGTGTQVWRADLEPQSKYGCADTFLTHGLVEEVLQEICQERQEQSGKIINWIFDDEVMPVCKEIVMDMKRKGVYIDVPYFTKLHEQNAQKLMQLEDEWIGHISPYLDKFDKGKSIDESVSQQRLVKKIIELEGLNIPKTVDKKTGEEKESIAKAVVKKEYEKNPHWIWGYILGEDEIKYSEEKLTQIKQQLYEEIEGRRYRFNLGSNDHLIWLFFDTLGENRKMFPKTDKSTTEDWKPSIDADSIKEHLLPKYAWVNTLLKYKKIQKMQSTYIAPALEHQIDGWLYMDMKQNGTTSGRFSCSGGYNLQTLPRVEDEQEALEKCSKCDSKDVQIDAYIECMANRVCNQCNHVEYDIPRPSSIKKGFIAPPGYKIINADYSSLEPRCFAYMSGEDNIKAVYRHNLDLYSKVYIDIFDKEGQYSADPKAPNFLKKLNGKARKFIKPLVLGIPYGAGDAQVANMTENFIEYTDDHGIVRQRPDMAKGKEIRDLYLDTYPKLREYMSTQEYMAIEYGFVESIYGRRKHFMWAKTVGDFFEKTACRNNLDLDKINKVGIFLATSKSKLQGCNATIKDFKTGNIIFDLTEEHLKELASKLKMSFTIDHFGNDGIKQKGGWSYIRSLMKADLNNAKNHPIQALAGHITNMGMLVTGRKFKEHNIDGWVCLQVHDEITAYAREDQAELAKTLLQRGMEENMFTLPLRDQVAMIAEPVICDSLKDSK